MSRMRRASSPWKNWYSRWGDPLFSLIMMALFLTMLWPSISADPLGSLQTVAEYLLFFGVAIGALYLVNRYVYDFSGYLPRETSFREASEPDRDKALELSPPSDRALLIVVRDGDVDGTRSLDVRLDGEVKSHLPGPGFSALTVSPGVHILEIELAPPKTSHGGPASVEITARAGEIIIYRAAVTMDWIKCYVALERLEATSETRRLLEPLPMMAA